MKNPEKYKGNRKAVTEYIASVFMDVDPTGINSQLVVQELGRLTDKQFAEFAQDMAEGKDFVRMYFPNGGKADVDVLRNQEIAKREFGYDFEQHLIIGSDDPDTPAYITPEKYMVWDGNFRRQSQTMLAGISVAEHHNTVDQRTGAVTGASAAAKCSGPEMGILRGNGMFETLIELISVRGGDQGAARAMEAQFMQTGEASIEASKRFGEGVGVVLAQHNMLMAMHLDNTLLS